MGRRRINPRESRRYYDWFNQAEDDMAAAELLMQNERCYNLSAFHCQQAIEKGLKGYILFRTGNLVDGHNLTWLCKQAVKLDGTFARWLSQSAKLNRCYIETRYPADIPLDLSLSKVKEAFQMSSDMLDFIFDQFEKESGLEADFS